ncbi:MAG: translation initiation factor IF-6 [Desulfurococcaceae archaeon TW002]
MPLEKLKVFGNPNIGVYIFTNNKVTLVPEGVEDDVKKVLRNVLETDIIEARVADSTLLGVFVAGNDKAILLPKIAKDEELDKLRSAGLPVKTVQITFTALGNVILTNNKFALLHPELSEKEADLIKSELGVSSARKGALARIPTVGSLGVLNDFSGVFHPELNTAELRSLEFLFGVRIGTATVNFGVGFVKVGLVMNNNGAVVGELTTGPEIMRIMEILNFSKT